MAAQMGRRAGRIACVLVAIFIAGYTLGAWALIWPDAPGDVVQKKSGMRVDASHASDGYVMVKYKESEKALKLRITKGEDTYTYDLNGEGRYEVIPLQLGSGKYKATLYRQVSGSKYAQAAQVSFKANLDREEAPFLCPNQYVWYEADSPMVEMARQLCAGLQSDREKVDAVIAYLKSNFSYNYVRALTVQSGYLPDLDAAFEEKMGICFDIAGITAAMLRTQGIPVKVVIGYADRAYHAWNMIYVDGAYELADVTSALTMSTAGTYTTERVY